MKADGRTVCIRLSLSLLDRVLAFRDEDETFSAVARRLMLTGLAVENTRRNSMKTSENTQGKQAR